MVKIIDMLIPKSNKRTRPGTKRDPRSITIHETDNTNVRANALAHAKLQYYGNARQASWQYQTDDEPEVYRSIPDDEVAYAAGDGKGPGNSYSIHIEMCVNQDGNYLKTVSNTVELVRYLLDKHPTITHIDVVQHHKWSGKNCPRYLRSGANGIDWNGFLKLVREGKSVAVVPVSKPKYETTNNNFSIGQQVRIKKSATHYATGQAIPAFVKGKTDTVLQRGSNRMLLKGIYSWVKTSDLEVLSSGKSTQASKTSKPKANLTVDGYEGPLTIKAEQRYHGTPVDGVISRPSLLIEARQKMLGVTQDGYEGPITIKAEQKRYGTPADGIISKPSLMIKERQRRLNNGKL